MCGCTTAPSASVGVHQAVSRGPITHPYTATAFAAPQTEFLHTTVKLLLNLMSPPTSLQVLPAQLRKLGVVPVQDGEPVDAVDVEQAEVKPACMAGRGIACHLYLPSVML